MAKYLDPPLFSPTFFLKNDSEWPKLNFKHDFEKREISFIWHSGWHSGWHSEWHSKWHSKHVPVVVQLLFSSGPSQISNLINRAWLRSNMTCYVHKSQKFSSINVRFSLKIKISYLRFDVGCERWPWTWQYFSSMAMTF